MSEASHHTAGDAANLALKGHFITSVTPNALRSDSRTLKQAASISRFGAISVVVEGAASNRDYSDFGIALRSMPSVEYTSDVPKSVVAGRVAAHRPWRALIKQMLPSPLVHARQFLQVLLSMIRTQWLPVFRLLPKSDIFILHSMTFWPAVWLKSRLTGVPYIYDAHDFYRDMGASDQGDDFTKRWLIPFYGWLDRRAVASAQSMMTVSPGVASLYKAADKVDPVIIKNCHDSRSDRGVERTIRDVVSLKADEFLIVAVGNAKPGSSIRTLIDVVSDLDDYIHLAFVGKDFVAEKSAHRSRNGSSRIHFVDAVPSDQVVPFISSANCAIIVYFAETEDYESALPNRFFQSAAARLPLIYPELRDMHALAQSIPFGVSFQPGNADGMRSAILAMVERRHDQEQKQRANHAALALTWLSEEMLFVDHVLNTLNASKGQKSHD